MLAPACSGPSSHTRDTGASAEELGAVYEAYTAAQLARHLDDFDTAIRYAYEAVRLAPEEAHLYLTLGELLRIEGRFLESAEILEEGLDHADDPSLIYLELAATYGDLDRPESAEQAYLSAIQSAPDTPEPYAQYADFASGLYGPERSAEILNAYITRQPEDAAGWRRLGELHQDASQWDPAFEAFGTANELEPDALHDYVALISIARERGDEEGGRRYAAECFWRFRQRVACRVQFILMLESLDMDDEERTVEEFEVLQALGRAIGANIGRLRNVEGHLGQHLSSAHASVFMGALADDRPRNTQIQTRAAWAAYRVGEEELAITYMRRVLEVRPRNPDALNFIGYSYAERAINLDEAERLIQTALEVRPNDGNIRDSLGWVYYQAERFEDALRELELAVSQIPDNPVILDHLADALRGLGENGRALEIYRTALDLVGEDDDLAQSIQAKIDELEATT
jgi:tetratricopeptide (TPR) repeat protein